MAQGKIIAEGPPDSVMSDKQVIDAYLGSHHDQDLSTMEEAVLAEAQAEITGTPAADREGAGTPSSDPAVGTGTGAHAAKADPDKGGRP
jgi:branched-chain amino acid transport system ATP-binding protein